MVASIVFRELSLIGMISALVKVGTVSMLRKWLIEFTKVLFVELLELLGELLGELFMEFVVGAIGTIEFDGVV